MIVVPSSPVPFFIARICCNKVLIPISLSFRQGLVSDG